MMSVIAMWSPGPMEMIVILFLALLFFGKRLPEVARSLGRGVKEFKGGLKDGHDESLAGELTENESGVESDNEQD